MEHDPELEGRLRAVGTRPIDPDLQSAHLTQMASAVQSARRRAKVRVAGIVAAGVLVGSTSLAAAGALPDPAQHFAHRALDSVGVEVPGPERYHGPECGAEVKRNHGAYVSDDKALAKSRLRQEGQGRPPRGGGTEPKGSPKARTKPKAEKGPCQGPPPWAGKDDGGVRVTGAEERGPRAHADARARHAATIRARPPHRADRRHSSTTAVPVGRGAKGLAYADRSHGGRSSGG